MDDSFFILLALLGFVSFVLGPIAFFLTLGARARLIKAETRIIELQQALRDARRPEIASATASPAAEEAPPEPILPATEQTDLFEEAPADALPEETAAAEIASPPPLPTESTQPAPAPPSLEETLGTRWAVWIGGIALALGALLLVRYSIEQGWFGPAARILLGLAFSAALIGAGEILRRRDPARSLPASRGSPQPSQIPAVLTAAGTVAAFGAIYAAHALYGFIGPAATFLTLGAIGAATMLAAALHGPALAGPGLLGALIAPLLVQSNEPSPWPVVLYLNMVIAFAYGLARLRLWLWLALSAAAGGFLWGLALLNSSGMSFTEAALLHAILQTLMATGLFAVINGAGIADDEAELDPFALWIPSAFAILALLSLNAASLSGLFGFTWIAGAAVTLAILAIGGLLASTAACLMLAAGVALALALLIWPANASLPVFPSEAWLWSWPYPKADSSYVAFAAITALLLALAAGKRLFDGRGLRQQTAIYYAGAAGLIPLATLAICYMRLAHHAANVPFAAIAGGLALAFLIAANLFFGRDAAGSQPNLRLGLGAFAAAALAALSLGLVFALDRGMLTVALALAALGAAFVDRRLGIGALRWCVAGLGLTVAARLLYEPRIVGADLGTRPLFNWLLWGYGVPALAFGIASQLLRRRTQDTPVLVAQALCIFFSALLVFFEIRHAIDHGDPFAETSSLIEQGLLTTCALAFSLVLTRLDATRTSPVLRLASLGFGVLSFALSLGALLAVKNPLWSGEPVEGGLVLNALLLAYGLPALLAVVLARVARGVRPNWFWQGGRTIGLLLVFAYANLELRRLFNGADLTWGDDGQIADAEVYSYSALWLTLSILCLAYGLWRGSVTARVASAILMLMTILKVFLYDLAGLDGFFRALSFIGLGLVLIGIGLVYQKLVFAPSRA